MSETLIVVFTGVVSVSTFLYMFITGWLTWETRKVRQAQTEPRIRIQAEQDHTGHLGYELVIRNVGQGPAKDVRFEFEGDPSYLRNSFVGKAPPSIDELPVIRDGLDYMEAGEEMKFFLGTMSPEEFSRAIEKPWKFTVKYKSISGMKTKTDICPVDFSQFEGRFFSQNWLQKMSECLSAIQKDLHRLTEGHARVQVVTQTREEFEKRREEWRKAQFDQIENATEAPTVNNDED